MSHSNSCCGLLQPQKIQFCLISQFMIFFFLLLLPHAKSVSFNYPNFNPNVDYRTLKFEGDAEPSPSKGVIQLTKNKLVGSVQSVGRASYNESVHLWDNSTGRLTVTDFTTHFSFTMGLDPTVQITQFCDGLAFFIAPFDSEIPESSAGGNLGLFGSNSRNQFVAVEFDTYQNQDWDPIPNHVGIDVNSIKSVAYVPLIYSTFSQLTKNGSRANAWVSYNSTTQNLSAFLTFADNPNDNSRLSYIVDLSKVLPEEVRVGFSAGTGYWSELHTIHSWSFNSSLKAQVVNKTNKVVPSAPVGPAIAPAGPAKSVSFHFPNFSSNLDYKTLKFEGDAYPSMSKGVIELTKNKLEGPFNSVGRASYDEPVRLWDNSTGRLTVTDFTTHFSFTMGQDPTNDQLTQLCDGLAFFIAPFDSEIPGSSAGGNLGLFGSNSRNQFVAVEFDTHQNQEWDDPIPNHVGIDVNSMKSVAYVTMDSTFSQLTKNGSRANAWVSYNSTMQNLSAFLTFADNPDKNSRLSYIVDLSKVLPEEVRVGFSAGIGFWSELHTIHSWSFNSSLETQVGNKTNKVVPMAPVGPTQKKKNRATLVIGLAVGFGCLSCGLGLLWFFRWRKRTNARKEDSADDGSMDDEFEKGAGPKMFTYRELSRATNNFAEEGKLGEGGFGGVYKGLLSESNTQVAVKKVSKGSKQGKKEYISEVKIISRLRHRNLVQLIGWCHEQGEFLLVYEFMPNGSLDYHLFGSKNMLTWPQRYKIAIDLASALLYLHEEWEQCVVHRDIKSSNVMLDSNFNAKLGDFGLARLVDHELGPQTTVVAGTPGYLALEYVTTRKASKVSDVYSFGVVSLEIACGRRPVDEKVEPNKIIMVDWVWDLYEKGQVLEAVDKRLSMEFYEQQMECLMVVGLWCCHPDPTVRPSTRQVINALNFEADTLPNLPPKVPVPMYFNPPVQVGSISNTSSSGLAGSMKENELIFYDRNCRTN